MSDMSQQPVCRAGITAEDLAREADRAVLYGAVLAAQRPAVRLKPAIAPAAYALLPEETLANCEKTSTPSTPAPFLLGLRTAGHAS